MHGLGSMKFGFVVQKFLNIEMISSLKLKLKYCLSSSLLQLSLEVPAVTGNWRQNCDGTWNWPTHSLYVSECFKLN